MSAITKPFVHFSTSLTPEAPIPVERIDGMEKLDVPHTPPRPGEIKEAYLLFTTPTDEPTLRLAFANAGDRDAAYDDGLAVISTEI